MTLLSILIATFFDPLPLKSPLMLVSCLLLFSASDTLTPTGVSSTCLTTGVPGCGVNVNSGSDDDVPPGVTITAPSCEKLTGVAGFDATSFCTVIVTFRSSGVSSKFFHTARGLLDLRIDV